MHASIASEIEVLGYHKNTENEDENISILFESFTLHGLSEGIKRKAIYLRKAYNLTLGDSLYSNGWYVQTSLDMLDFEGIRT